MPDNKLAQGEDGSKLVHEAQRFLSKPIKSAAFPVWNEWVGSVRPRSRLLDQAGVNQRFI
jgi:hypothetical protein